MLVILVTEHRNLKNKIELSIDNIIRNTNEKINDGINDAKRTSKNFLSNK